MSIKTIIGVMGPGEGASEQVMKQAFQLGRLVAQEGWTLLTGGRNCGVMEAASKGAKENSGLTIGILPAIHTEGISVYVDIPIITGLNEARNYINILTSHVIVACGMNAGTASEVALAIKAGKPVILLEQTLASIAFFKQFQGRVSIAESPEQAIDQIKNILNS